ncbi:MATE family efflux transporter [Clostridium sp. 1001271B_151109_B4]|uniref:MATE family efflux transporter n=1 Tax=Clostridium sp. 1001271B_151109_B4 TaxID=2787148 RepID=UPI0018A9F462|nr:MATE family efflux transporter [Clostridium sp. 1001271B_151109_B4]
MDLSLGKENIGKLFVKYSIPSVIAMIVFSIYIVVDGIFVGNVVGSKGLSAVNIAMPFFGIAMAIGIMVAIGGGTITSIELGKGNRDEARKTFSLAFYSLIIITLTLSVFTVIFSSTIARILGANDDLVPLVVEYLVSLCLFLATFVGSSYLSNGLRVMGKPNHAMVADIISSVLNIVLDYIFIVKMNLGLAGAGFASGIAFTVGFLFALTQYLKRDSILKFCKVKFDLKKIVRIFYNGSSEGITQFAVAFSTYIFNIVLMVRIGEMGVSAFSIILYIASLVTAVFSGICNGISPIISFNYGANNNERIGKILKLAILTISIIGVFSAIIMVFGGETLIAMFVDGDSELVKITTEATNLYSIAFVFNGLNILASAYFTALENARTSAIISVLRGVILIIVFIITLPMILGDIGIWLTVPISELVTVIIAINYMKKTNKNVVI